MVVGSTGNSLCPVSASFGYLKMWGNNPGPWFKWQDGTPLARSAFVARFRQASSVAGYIESEVQQYSGHSFRAGAASAALGVGDSLKKYWVDGKAPPTSYTSSCQETTSSQCQGYYLNSTNS